MNYIVQIKNEEQWDAVWSSIYVEVPISYDAAQRYGERRGSKPCILIREGSTLEWDVESYFKKCLSRATWVCFNRWKRLRAEGTL